MKFATALLACAALAAVSGAGAPPAQAQDDMHEVVKSIITDTVGDGEHLVGRMRSGELEEGESDTFTVRISPNKHYMIYSSCDFDCDDLDMAIVDEDGEDIDVDYEDDDVPIIDVEPGESGRELRIRVDMETCSEEVCVWAVGVYEQED